MPALHHALLGASVVALAAAGLRLASPLAERGLARGIAAAVFATAAAVAEAILLGLVSLGGSTAALTVAAFATGAAAFAYLPRPVVPVGSEVLGWWRGGGARARWVPPGRWAPRGGPRWAGAPGGGPGGRRGGGRPRLRSRSSPRARLCAQPAARGRR